MGSRLPAIRFQRAVKTWWMTSCPALGHNWWQRSIDLNYPAREIHYRRLSAKPSAIQQGLGTPCKPHPVELTYLTAWQTLPESKWLRADRGGVLADMEIRFWFDARESSSNKLHIWLRLAHLRLIQVPVPHSFCRQMNSQSDLIYSEGGHGCDEKQRCLN